MVDTAPAAIWSEGMVRLLRNQLLFFLLRFKMMIIIKLPSNSMIVVLPYERELHNKQIETANSVGILIRNAFERKYFQCVSKTTKHYNSLNKVKNLRNV